MKCFWKVWDRLGISAVGGTAATLGITVVMVSLLYGMVGDLGGEAELPTFGAIASIDKVSAGEYKIVLSKFVPEPSFDACKVAVTSPSEAQYRWAFQESDEGLIAVNDNTTNDGCTLKVVDLGGDGLVSMFDYLKLSFSGAVEQGTWTVYVLSASSGSIITSTTFEA